TCQVLKTWQVSRRGEHGMSKQRLIEEAQKTLDGHEFKQLASWGDGSSEVWECSRPGSSVYAFTICITRMGIAILGDIDGLTFNVGSNYGMPFLAGNDVSYYIHSKLESDCKKQELNQERLLEWITTQVANHIGNQYRAALGTAGIDLPEWIGDHDYGLGDFEPLKDFVYDVYQKLELMHDLWDWFHACHDFLDSVEGVNDEQEVYALDLDEVDFAWYDAPSLTQPAESLMFRLYLVNEAAKRIMVLKEKDKG
ncbi:MAG: hypothetical protein V1791_06820, partial [Pseudomonadota bacterium]